MIKIITKKELIAINAYLIKKGSPNEIIGIKDVTALDMCVNSVNYSAFGEQVYPTITDKAAILYINLVKKHCFHNANKRTAHMALVLFLQMNGYKWTMNKLDSVEFAVYVANWSGSFDELKLMIINKINENIEKN